MHTDCWKGIKQRASRLPVCLSIHYLDNTHKTIPPKYPKGGMAQMLLAAPSSSFPWRWAPQLFFKQAPLCLASSAFLSQRNVRKKGLGSPFTRIVQRRWWGEEASKRQLSWKWAGICRGKKYIQKSLPSSSTKERQLARIKFLMCQFWIMNFLLF